MPTSPLSNIVYPSTESTQSILQRIETSTSPTADDVVDFESVKRHLRAIGMEDDQTILDKLRAAVREAERRTNRTLRQSVTSTVYYTHWAYAIPLPYPPAQSVTSVKYYDTDDTLQTVSASDYAAKLPTEGQGFVSFQADYTFPNINTDREDPIQIIFVRGWGSDDAIPADLKDAIRFFAESSYDGDESKYHAAIRRCQGWVHRGLI